MLRMLPILSALLLLGCTPRQHVHVTAPGGKWISLFDGKDLNGWTVKIAHQDLNDNYRNTFRVEDGLLQVSYDQYDRFGGRFGSLFYNTPFSHYWIRAEYRFVGNKVRGAPGWAYKNSGLQLHSQSPQSMDKDQEFPVDVEFDMVGGHFIGSRPTGNVCQTGTHVKIGGVTLRSKCSDLSDITIRDDQWTIAEAEVDGSRRVRQIVNGELVVEYTDLTLDDADPQAHKLLAAGADRALSRGYISIQSNGAPVEFRRIEILPLDDAGTEPKPAD